MDVLQLFKRDHARMKDLFAKLSDTSEGALKTRERLLGQLTIEFEAHKTVVKERLYPILSKHKETRDLKPSARELNQVDRQLARVAKMPHDDPDFLHAVRELRKALDEHLREEEREIVPALKKALEPDAYEQLAKDFAEAKREELQEVKERNEQQRDDQRGESDMPRIGPDPRTAQQLLRDMGGAAQSVLKDQAEVSTVAAQAGGASLHKASKLISDGMGGAATVSREIQGAFVDGVTEALRTNLETMQELMKCGSATELSRLQRRFLARSAELYMQTGMRVFRAAQHATLSGLGTDEAAASDAGGTPRAREQRQAR